ncbi:MAG TPA: recombinase family protein [Trebonia sp.]|nr:recombinase family protein [Trebonia sp.]
MLDDASTSPERQVEKIKSYAQVGDHELTPVSERDYDLNVSGSVNPFERPGLGPWLRDDRLSMWDAICVTQLDRLTRRVQAASLEAAVSSELLRLVGDAELKEMKRVPDRDCSGDIARVADQIGHLFSEIQVEALAGVDVREKQETLKRAQEELARIHALKRAEGGLRPASTGQTFRQLWEVLDAAGRNKFLRGAGVRASVEYWDGAVPHEWTPEIYRDNMCSRIDLGKLAKLRAPDLRAVRPQPLGPAMKE